MLDSQSSDTSSKWIPTQKDGYKLYQSGSHIEGNFIQVFVPDSPYCDEQGKHRLIAYLHGFALCMPKFYEKHLEKLARQGYYVFFPDFQKSNYPNSELKDEKTRKSIQVTSQTQFWFSVFLKSITAKTSEIERFSTEEFFNDLETQSQKVPKIQGKLSQPNRFSYLSVSLSLLVMIPFLRIMCSKYGEPIVSLITTVGFSLAHKPSELVENAITLTKQAWQKLCDDNPDLAKYEFDFYVFGHSLGGLLALSWSTYICETSGSFSPKQIITADPVPDNVSSLPGPVQKMLLATPYGCPLNRLTISQVGQKIIVPVGIMHGADDTLVQPQSWIRKKFLIGAKSNFDYIGSQQKKIYFSLSNKQQHPPLIAFHNQAVTDTTYLEDVVFKFFGGAKKDPNAYNYEYIWPGLDLVIRNQARADELLDKFPLKSIEVTSTLPSKFPFLTLVMSFVVLALLGVILCLPNSLMAFGS